MVNAVARSTLLVSVLFSVGLARIFSVLSCVARVTRGSVSMMRGLLVLTAFVVFGSLRMMTGGVPVML